MLTATTYTTLVGGAFSRGAAARKLPSPTVEVLPLLPRIRMQPESIFGATEQKWQALIPPSCQVLLEMGREGQPLFPFEVRLCC
jgi:hypothetical protein